MRRRTSSNPLRQPAFLLGSLIFLTSVAACNTPPSGSTGGRIDPYRSTPADMASSKASMPAMMEFTDRTAQALAQDITAIPEIRDSPQPVIIEMGSIRNQTRTPTSDFEQIQARLRGQLFSSDIVRRHVVFVEDVHRMDRELERIEATGTDGRAARYAADQTYVLQGDFYESDRSDTRRYYFEFKLVNLASRMQVFHEDYDLGQVAVRPPGAR